LQEFLHFGRTSSLRIFVTRKGDEIIAAQALKAGALDYIPKESYHQSFYLNAYTT